MMFPGRGQKQGDSKDISNQGNADCWLQPVISTSRSKASNTTPCTRAGIQRVDLEVLFPLLLLQTLKINQGLLNESENWPDMHFCICRHPTHLPPFLLLPLFPGTHPALKNIFGLGGCSRWGRVHRGHAAPGLGGIPQPGCQKQDQPWERSTRASGSCRKRGSLRSQSAEPAWEKQRSWSLSSETSLNYLLYSAAGHCLKARWHL